MTTRPLLIALTMVAAAVQPALPDVTEGLIAHWRLDDVEGKTVTDSAGDHEGVNRGATVGQSGILGKAFAFDHREDDYVDFGNRLQLAGGNEVTVAALVWPESFNPPDATNLANSRNGILGSDDANFIFALSGQGRPTFVFDAGTNDYQQIVTEPNDCVPLGTYSHVVVTRAGATMTLYINGVAKMTVDRYDAGNFVRFGRMHLGRVNNSTRRDFHGRIDDVQVYSRALSAAAVRQLADEVGLGGVVPPKPPPGSRGLQRLKYNHPGLVVDLGVGLWALPLPMDYDGDGDFDLVVSCADVPYNGTYFFENTQGNVTFPTFKPGRRIGPGIHNVQVSHVGGKARVLLPEHECVGFRENGFDKRVKLPAPQKVHETGGRIRANQWKLADYDGDGRADLIVGIGDWTDYGWDNAFNQRGEWTRGPLRGFVYWLRNGGTVERPDYQPPQKIVADGRPLEVFGMPSPNLADFDGDGDLDIICGEFVDGLTWFQNTGTRTAPKYAAGRRLTSGGRALRMDLCMIVPVAVDWDCDGDVDLVVGEEDGRVALLEHTGEVVDGMPQFRRPVHFRQQADEVKFGALVTPVGVDFDDDGDEDLVCGNTAGTIGLIENLDGRFPPRWAAPRYIESDGRPIRIMAGPNGSIQGPCEAKWGYTTLSVADWDHDSLPDLVVNSIWGKVVWYRNTGTPKHPEFTAASPIEVQWDGPPPKPPWNWWNPHGKQLATQWRTTPLVVDFDEDGLNDLVMLDHEGYLAWFERVKINGVLQLKPPQRAFAGEDGRPLRLNAGEAGRSGRRKLCAVDWDRDGRLDLLANSRNVDLLQNTGTRDGRTVLTNRGQLDPRRLAGHTTSPTVVDWDRNGVPDLVVGGEDGYLYYLRNPHATEAAGAGD